MGPARPGGGDAERPAGERLNPGAWLELLLPTRCLGCGGAGGGPDGLPVCPRCRTRLQDLPRPRCPRCHHPEAWGGGACRTCQGWPDILVRARSAALFLAPVPELVHGLKYQAWPLVARWMASRMTTLVAIDPEWPRPRAVVPVPTTPKRFRERGFNPAELLARGVARRLGIPVVNALDRPLESPRQVGLPPSVRAANVRGVFVPRGTPFGSSGSLHVLLVDDVLTTGATAAEAAQALEGCGAGTVSMLTFARALPTDPSVGGRAA